MRGLAAYGDCCAFAWVILIVVPGALSSVDVEGTRFEKDIITQIESTPSCKDGDNIVENEKLLFHQDGRKNAVITNNNTLAYMYSQDHDRPYSAILTNRHLKDNELFEIKLERRPNSTDESLYFMAIGVTNHSYADLNRINAIEPRNWMMQWHIPADNETDWNFQKFLKFGIRLGVMRRENGTLDIFVNGVNEGAIDSNVPKPVYGAIEFLTGGLQATIIGTHAMRCQQ